MGGRVFYNQTDQFYFGNLPDFLTALPEMRTDGAAFLNRENAFQLRTYETERGSYKFAFELLKPPVSLLIFGASADAIPLAEIAALLGWQVTVADHRPAFLTKERFPAAKNLILNNSQGFPPEIVADDQTAAVVITHNYEGDHLILSSLLKSQAFYIGALGPKRRTESSLQELKENGETFTDRQLKRLYNPNRSGHRRRHAGNNRAFDCGGNTGNFERAGGRFLTRPQRLDQSSGTCRRCGKRGVKFERELTGLTETRGPALCFKETDSRRAKPIIDSNSAKRQRLRADSLR